MGGVHCTTLLCDRKPSGNMQSVSQSKDERREHKEKGMYYDDQQGWVEQASEEEATNQEEAYYYETLRAFEELIKKHGAGNVILDMDNNSVRALFDAYPRSLWT